VPQVLCIRSDCLNGKTASENKEARLCVFFVLCVSALLDKNRQKIDNCFVSETKQKTSCPFLIRNNIGTVTKRTPQGRPFNRESKGLRSSLKYGSNPPQSPASEPIINHYKRNVYPAVSARNCIPCLVARDVETCPEPESHRKDVR